MPVGPCAGEPVYNAERWGMQLNTSSTAVEMRVCEPDTSCTMALQAPAAAVPHMVLLAQKHLMPYLKCSHLWMPHALQGLGSAGQATWPLSRLVLMWVLQWLTWQLQGCGGHRNDLCTGNGKSL